jgi:hypothetical protein
MCWISEILGGELDTDNDGEILYSFYFVAETNRKNQNLAIMTMIED